MSSVRPSVRDVEVCFSHRLEFFENNFTAEYLKVHASMNKNFKICLAQHMTELLGWMSVSWLTCRDYYITTRCGCSVGGGINDRLQASLIYLYLYTLYRCPAGMPLVL